MKKPFCLFLQAISGAARRRSVATLASASLVTLLAGCASLYGSPGMSGTRASRIAGDGITVFAAGDIADCRRVTAARSGAARTADVIAAGLAEEPTAVVLALGDLTYPVGLPEEYARCYAPTWGRFLERTIPAPGNHEYYTAGAPGYFGYFGTRAGPGTRGYFSTQVGSWHVVSLNSNLASPASEEQLAWLADDLARFRARPGSGCLLAFWHHPVYSSGGHGNSPRMLGAWRLLMEAHADVVLASHDHGYERFAPQDAAANLDARRGIRSFVVGNGGAQLTPFRATQAHSQAQDNFSHGVLKMHLLDGGYDWAFLPVGGGAPRDAGSARCHRR